MHCLQQYWLIAREPCEQCIKFVSERHESLYNQRKDGKHEFKLLHDDLILASRNAILHFLNAEQKDTDIKFIICDP